jgi:hypothetical protein
VLAGTEQPPSRTDWDFHTIAAVHPGRALKLENAGTPDELITALDHALDRAFSADAVKIGCNFEGSDPTVPRATFQFSLSGGPAMLFPS